MKRLITNIFIFGLFYTVTTYSQETQRQQIYQICAEGEVLNGHTAIARNKAGEVTSTSYEEYCRKVNNTLKLKSDELLNFSQLKQLYGSLIFLCEGHKNKERLIELKRGNCLHSSGQTYQQPQSEACSNSVIYLKIDEVFKLGTTTVHCNLKPRGI